MKEEPLIPIGLGLTCYALFGATRSIRRGDKTRTNMYFRARVYAQAFTLLVLCVGSIYWKEDRQKRKQYEGLVGEKKAAEKRDAWIRELEARDEEDQKERKRRQQRREDIRAGRLDPNGQPPSVRANSVMTEQELRKLALNSNILAPAMWIWKSRADQD
ncbi:hypothetical protein FH972_021130 [Carpinus fangiana]|uniref:HIG1 domain-containing protein n=1 Tax=Carpinus fangiana TaxID=176857 RepID=A0A5N6KNH5_9ROSI|nr:hypothetical protein FH972_021130 [Carpinus fangiana]